MKILQCAHFSAPYEGNFVRSLCSLESRLIVEGHIQAYVFPRSASKQFWWKNFERTHQVFVTCDDVSHSEKELLKICDKFCPDVIHSHFEGYDIPAVKVSRSMSNKIKVVWHLRDMIDYHNNPLKRLYQKFCFFRHYNYFAKEVSIISVSDQILDFVLGYKKMFGSPFKHMETIPNGIDFNRISNRIGQVSNHNPYTFLSFGSRNVQKRVDLLLSAAKLLIPQYDIRIVITKGVDTEFVVMKYFCDSIPGWCQLIDQNDDINEVFKLANCFVSTSVHETFSNAICEASVYGLPVIQSDIVGTKWNSVNPSAFEFRSGDTEDLANVMRQVIEFDKEELHLRCLQTRNNNIHHYGIDNWCQKVINFYSQL